MNICLDEESSSVSEPFHSYFVVLRKCVFACLPLSLLGKTLSSVKANHKACVRSLETGGVSLTSLVE